MDKLYLRTALFFVSLLLFTSVASAGSKGIYVTQWNFENTSFVKYLIKNAKAAGIDTFVIDLELPNHKKYRENIDLLKQNNIKYVARIIMFPGGGTPTAIKTPEIWQKKYSLVKYAIDLGASEIQLDYIRYRSAQQASSNNSKDILNIIQWYKNKLAGQNIPLQIDVFGITSFGESKHIGQNVQLFSQTVDAICPMVYPSHYWPYQKYAKIPYETVYDSLKRIQKQFGDPMPIKMYAYIELSNFHYPKMSRDQKLAYIKAQIKAVHNAGADGWYAWSPHNRYENLFAILKSQQGVKEDGQEEEFNYDSEIVKEMPKQNKTAKIDQKSQKEVTNVAEEDVNQPKQDIKKVAKSDTNALDKEILTQQNPPKGHNALSNFISSLFSSTRS